MLSLPTLATDDTLRIVLHEGSRNTLWPLFRLADDSAVAIRRYLDQGVVHVATIGGVPVGHSQVVHVEGGSYELRSLAVLPRHRRRGLGTRLLARSASWVRDRSGNRLVTAAASAALDVLKLYQLLGFRLLRVHRDADGPDGGYRDGVVALGIPVRDRVWLELEIRGAGSRGT